MRLRRCCSALVPFQTTAGKEQRADEPLANCSKKDRFMNSRRRELYVNSRKSDRAAGCANHRKSNSCAEAPSKAIKLANQGVFSNENPLKRSRPNSARTPREITWESTPW
jgi:hypothetical protein